MARTSKFVKRIAKKAGSAIKKRYFKGKGYSKPKLVQMAKDVMLLKKMVNAEKKRFVISSVSQAFGQVNANANGYYALDITPTPSQGTTSITRNGNSIRLHSSYLQFQFAQQSSANQPIKGEILLFRVNGDNVSNVSTWLNSYFNANPFITGANIIDYNSTTNPDFYKTGTIIRRKKFTMAVDQISGQLMLTTVKVGMKYKSHHVRYQADGNQVPSYGQIFMMIRVDSGNSSTTTASTLGGIYVPQTNTGLQVSHNITHYFYDN